MSFQTMSLYCAPGTKVRYMDKNGYEGCKAHARLHLVPGQIYTVNTVSIHSSSSSVTLEEFPYESFNTVMFMKVDDV